MTPISSPPIVWTIAGSDPGGGAGIQADLKVMNAFGVHGCSVITALTAQNTRGVHSSESVSEAMLRAQLQTLETDLPPAAIKTGMLGSAATCRILAEFLATHLKPKAQSLQPFLICDPVLKSTSGADLLDPAALDMLIHGIFPKVGILTPNLPEVGKLIGGNFKTVEAAAERILELGVCSVLIKGGHADGSECRDYWTDGHQSLWLSSPRIETSATHGTGCILSSAIASAIALGQLIPEAIATAKTFLNQCLKSPANLGTGHGPMRIEPFRNDPKDRPSVVVDGVADPVPQNPGSAAPPTTPGSPTPATTKHSHLRRLSKIFIDDPIYFVTTCTKGRIQILDNPVAHEILRDEWQRAMERHGWSIGSYVVMPDHVHFFCKPTHTAIKLSKLMQHWKQWTSKRIKQELHLDDSVWQDGFFDHLLRSNESYSDKWNYVEQNPVRAELVERAADWPYVGFIHYK
ncbi:MAG: bifunctional hydroxymethylpyrimidine kinase/phosphomethylpyrimidine kinase [Kiritimatiellales bacterium]|nr:bifunctional hydroxymethylpyrimidine kinase/phosphomethylpyrimidine kinase [Kiritimatiellales bacterium]MCF7863642.1 bifunctional hydroxymethylpyrimidine kinase/phosphomethylpyrimidine kinase [Kiritimatiellales bacterium]